MSTQPRNTFKKSERLCSRLLMERLFQGKNQSVSAYPLRAVFLPVEQSVQEGVSVLISVPKKRFHDGNYITLSPIPIFKPIKYSTKDSKYSKQY